MANFEPYIFFNGNCAEAMKFYEKTLGGKLLTLMKAKDSPAAGHTPPGKEDQILHSRLEYNGEALMASDWMDTKPYPGMVGFSIAVAYPKVEDAKRVYDALSNGGKVGMPMLLALIVLLLFPVVTPTPNRIVAAAGDDAVPF